MRAALPFLLTLTLLATLFAFPNAISQEDNAPPRIVFDAYRVTYQDAYPYYTLDGYLRWMASPTENATTEYQYVVEGLQVPLTFVTIKTVADRADWRTFTNGVDEDGYLAVTLDSSNNTTRLEVQTVQDSVESGISCSVTLEARVGVYQCGSPPLAGVPTLAVNTTSTSPVTATILHTNASRSTLGHVFYEYQYRVFGDPTWNFIEENSSWERTTRTTANFTFPNALEGETAYIEWRLRARDNQTREASAWSCTAAAFIGDVNETTYGCGRFSSIIPGAQGDAQIPMFDSDNYASLLGVDSTLLSIIAASIIMLGIVLAVTTQAGVVGGAVAFAGALIMGWTWNVVPTWGIVTIFMAAVAFGTFQFVKGSGTQ